MKKRIRIFLPILVIVAMLASAFGMALPVAAGGLAPAGVGPAAHGIGIAKSATGPTGQGVALEGETVNVTITVYSLDNSGDAMNVTSIVDTVYHKSGSNSSGNLLSSPVVLLVFGSSVTVSYTYVVDAGDNDPLIDNAAAYATDTVTKLPYTATGGAQIDIVHPCIHIVKTTNGGDGLDIPMGAPVTWTYNVTNCGDVALSNITVTDSHAGVTPAYVSGDDGDNILQTSEAWIFEASGTAGAGTYTNTGYVDGYYGTTLVEDDDASSYFGINPCIHIEKTTNGGDGLNISVGDPVTWTYTVTNCGNVPLSNIAVTDSHAGVTPAYVSGDDGDNILQTTETWIFEASGTAVAGTYTNTGYVDGYYGTTLVEDDDASSYFGTNPSIDLEKYVNGNDADSPTGPVVAVGSTVTFTFNVTNTGNIALTTVVVNDNVLGYIGTIPSLAAGASQTFTKTALAAAGQHTNVGNVTSAEGATDSDPGNYFGQSQQCTGCLKICKYEDKNGNGQKDCGESYLSGWTFNITDSQGNSQLVTTGGASVACGSCGSSDYCVTICGLAPGEYTVTETLKAGWICTTGNPRAVTVVCDKTTTVTFGNQKPCPGYIKIYKYNDKNGNGKKDWGESYLSGWTFNVTDSQGKSWSGTTGAGGYVTISNLAPGAYTIKETLKTGWICTTGNPLNNVTVASGKTTTVYFGNKQQCCKC